MDPSDADVAIAAAQAGAAVVARTYGNSHTRFAKSATDFTTQTDLDAEAAIIEVLDKHCPEDAHTGEESGSSGDDDAARRWLVDPLCGTLNFSAGTPLVVVNVALMAGDAPLAAAAADPIAEELFWTDGSRAFRRQEHNDEVLRPTAQSGLVDVNCDGPLDQPFVGGQPAVNSSAIRCCARCTALESCHPPWASRGWRPVVERHTSPTANSGTTCTSLPASPCARLPAAC